MVKKSFRLGIVGHRIFSKPDEISYAHFCCHRLLATLKAKCPQVVAISALSPGADSVFAQAAVSLGISLETVIPFQDFDAEFEDPFDAERYHAIRGRATSETIVGFEHRSKPAYKRSMEWIVFKSDAVVAVWDGRKLGSVGGTWQAVALAMKLRKSLLHVNYKQRSIDLYHNRNGGYSLSKNLPLNLAVGSL